MCVAGQEVVGLCMETILGHSGPLCCHLVDFQDTLYVRFMTLFSCHAYQNSFSVFLFLFFAIRQARPQSHISKHSVVFFQHRHVSFFAGAFIARTMGETLQIMTITAGSYSRKYGLLNQDIDYNH